MLMASFLVSHILSQIPVYAITDDTLTILLMVQIDNGLEMSLTKQYFEE